MMEDTPNQEMERRLTEHFTEESRRLRAPATIWSSVRSRLAADSERRQPWWRGLFSLRQWRPVHAFAAVVVVALAGSIWAFNYAPFQGSAEEDSPQWTDTAEFSRSDRMDFGLEGTAGSAAVDMAPQVVDPQPRGYGTHA